MDYFNRLLCRYLANNLSGKDAQKYYELISSDALDMTLSRNLLIELEQETSQPVTLEEKVILNRIFSKVQHAIRQKEATEAVPLYPPEVKKRKRMRISAVAAVFIIALVLATTWLGREFMLSGRVTIVGPEYLHLPDGTTVLLNDGSTLNYIGPSYGKNHREIHLSGEAYFDVVHNPNAPFVVHTGKISTRVLGTTFNVQAYPRDPDVTVTVIRGKVEVSNGKRILGPITKDQQVMISHQGNNFVRSEIEDGNTMLWKSKYLILGRISLDEAARLISKKYSVDVVVADTIRNCSIIAKFLEGERLEQVIGVVSATLNVQYSIEGRKVYLWGGSKDGCK